MASESSGCPSDRPFAVIARLRDKLRRRRRRLRYQAAVALDGAAFAEAATAIIKEYGDGSTTIRYDAAENAYLVGPEPGYRFSHPGRLMYFLEGLAYRGRQLHSEYLLDVIPFEDGDHIVESGGNDGDFSLALSTTGKRLSLIAFEPAPREYATLCWNLAHAEGFESAEARQQALWNESGVRLPFYIKSATADSSVVPIDGATQTVEVDAVRLDEAIPRRRYKLLKLEAEGVEPEILHGAAGVLDCFDYITADVGFERGVRQESTLPDVTNFLLKNGFEVVRLHRPRVVVLYKNSQLRTNL